MVADLECDHVMVTDFDNLLQVRSYVGIVEQNISMGLQPCLVVQTHYTLSSQSSTKAMEERSNITVFIISKLAAKLSLM